MYAIALIQCIFLSVLVNLFQNCHTAAFFFSFINFFHILRYFYQLKDIRNDTMLELTVRQRFISALRMHHLLYIANMGSKFVLSQLLTYLCRCWFHLTELVMPLHRSAYESFFNSTAVLSGRFLSTLSGLYYLMSNFSFFDWLEYFSSIKTFFFLLFFLSIFAFFVVSFIMQ